MLTPRLDILSPPQRRLWTELTQVPQGFVLYGGTAMALRLGHRRSDDFDFFSNRDFSPAGLERRVPFLRSAIRLRSEPNGLVVRVHREGVVMVSFFGNLGLVEWACRTWSRARDFPRHP